MTIFFFTFLAYFKTILYLCTVSKQKPRLASATMLDERGRAGMHL